MQRPGKWRWALAIVASLVATAGGAHAAATTWVPEELGAAEATAAPALQAGEARVVTLNAWRLATNARVPGYVGAVDAIAAELGQGGGSHPEMLSIQEIQSREVLAELEQRFAGEGTHFASCVCSVRADGSVREAVVGVTAPPVIARSSECIDLGAMFPDHERCAVLIRGELGGRPVDFVSTHLAWHVENSPMVERLMGELSARGALGPGTVIAGDFNAWPGSTAHEAMIAGALRDARPGAGRTHSIGGRIDYVLLGEGLDVVRAIDRRSSYEAVQPTAALALPDACATEGPPACPVSDHLPEAVVVRAR